MHRVLFYRGEAPCCSTWGNAGASVRRDCRAPLAQWQWAVCVLVLVASCACGSPRCCQWVVPSIQILTRLFHSPHLEPNHQDSTGGKGPTDVAPCTHPSADGTLTTLYACKQREVSTCRRYFEQHSGDLLPLAVSAIGGIDYCTKNQR